MDYRLLLLEDDEFLRDGLTEILTKEGYDLKTVDCISEAEKLIHRYNFDLMIFDAMLPDGSGFDLCSKVRSIGNDTPILFLTAKDDEIQIVRGLDLGADDYVTKPFRLLELLSRIRALLRRNVVKTEIKVGGLVLDNVHFTAKKDGENILLTPIEFRLLNMIVSAGGSTVTRNILLQNIWDDSNNFIDDNTLSVHISRLREKVGASHIVTVRGVGYRWED